MTLLAQASDAAILEQIKALQQPVSHSAVIAAFGLLMMLGLIWVLRRQTGDKRYIMEQFILASNKSTTVIDSNTKALTKLQDAIQSLKDTEHEIGSETRDMAKLLLSHPCLLFDTHHRRRVLEEIDSMREQENHAHHAD